MWRVKTVTKFKNSFSPVLIYWNAKRIHLGIIEKLNFPIWFPPLLLAPWRSSSTDPSASSFNFHSAHATVTKQSLRIAPAISMHRKAAHATRATIFIYGLFSIQKLRTMSLSMLCLITLYFGEWRIMMNILKSSSVKVIPIIKHKLASHGGSSKLCAINIFKVN